MTELPGAVLDSHDAAAADQICARMTSELERHNRDLKAHIETSLRDHADVMRTILQGRWEPSERTDKGRPWSTPSTCTPPFAAVLAPSDHSTPSLRAAAAPGEASPSADRIATHMRPEEDGYPICDVITPKRDPTIEEDGSLKGSAGNAAFDELANEHHCGTRKSLTELGEERYGAYCDDDDMNDLTHNATTNMIKGMVTKNSKKKQVQRGASGNILAFKDDRVLRARDSFNLLVHSKQYEITMGSLIVLNVVVTMLETEIRSQALLSATSVDEYGSRPLFFWVLRDLFTIVFTIDLGLRMIAKRDIIYFFSKSKEWHWNVFDVFVVLGAIIETVGGHVADGDNYGNSSPFMMVVGNSALLRILRLLRVVRVSRVVKSVVFFRDLRIMVMSLIGACKSLGWCLMTMLVVYLIFGVFFTESALTHCVTSGEMFEDSTEDLRYFFGTLFNSMASLFMATTGGMDWSDVVLPLRQIGMLHVGVFYLFMVFAIFALTNIITAMVVESTMRRSQDDRDWIIQTEISEQQGFLENMKQVFTDLDRDDSDEIILTELEKHLAEEQVQAYFKALGLNVREVQRLFKLMDVDKSGSIDMEEFLCGCVKLRGPAQNLDVGIIQFQVTSLQMMLKELGGHLSEVDDKLMDVKHVQHRSLAALAQFPNSRPRSRLPTDSSPRPLGGGDGVAP